jgi:hypothetical protein
MSPQRPAPAAHNTDEMVVPGRIGVVVASCVLTAGASTTVRLARRVRPPSSPGQATPGAGPVVDPSIDTRHWHRRNGFEPATGRTSGNNHTASNCGRAGERLRIGKEGSGHSASTVGFQRRHWSSHPPTRAEPKGKARTTDCITISVRGGATGSAGERREVLPKGIGYQQARFGVRLHHRRCTLSRGSAS